MYYIIVGREAIQVGPTCNESRITQRIGMSPVRVLWLLIELFKIQGFKSEKKYPPVANV